MAKKLIRKTANQQWRLSDWKTMDWIPARAVIRPPEAGIPPSHPAGWTQSKEVFATATSPANANGSPSSKISDTRPANCSPKETQAKEISQTQSIGPRQKTAGRKKPRGPKAR
jgi:hypothetical protein